MSDHLLEKMQQLPAEVQRQVMDYIDFLLLRYQSGAPANADVQPYKIKALETIEGLVTENKLYTVYLIKDEYFPEGEESIIGDDGDYITLLSFKGEKVYS